MQPDSEPWQNALAAGAGFALLGSVPAVLYLLFAHWFEGGAALHDALAGFSQSSSVLSDMLPFALNSASWPRVVAGALLLLTAVMLSVTRSVLLPFAKQQHRGVLSTLLFAAILAFAGGAAYAFAATKLELLL